MVSMRFAYSTNQVGARAYSTNQRLVGRVAEGVSRPRQLLADGREREPGAV